jgi:membrane protein implicated in regulation of membrane protease activity
MNRALLIIGIPAVGVATFYVAVLWGRWAAVVAAIGLSLLLLALAELERRRRRTGREHPAGRS